MAVLCLVVFQSQAADEKKADKDKLEGTWELVSYEVNGKVTPAPEGKGMTLTFKDGKVTKKAKDEKDEEGTYKIDDTKKPAEIDMTTPKKGKPDEKETMKGIFMIDGDTLKIGFTAKGPDAPRPTAFDGKETGIMNFKRKK
jgi:uncharacterized protein (TIGR03067 family)